MNNEVQLNRYKKLLAYLDENFKEEINIPKIEAISHYSYRNINRIFEALHQETIGKYIKRLRLEKAAQYLAYSDLGVSDIAYEVGFKDRAAFSKAFKSKYGYAPSAFRASNESIRVRAQETVLQKEGADRQKIRFEIVHLPDFEYLLLAYRGSYNDVAAIENVAQQLYQYALEKGILNERSIFMTEIIDDSELGDHIHLRYNVAFILERPLKFEPEGHYRIKNHKRQKYAKFTHQGTHQSCIDFHNRIYALWMLDIQLELEDRPTLEFYPNADENGSPDGMITEIYIPVH
ncbi:MAG: AraC family transcriptional regulator [Bacteroidota bacterium]